MRPAGVGCLFWVWSVWVLSSIPGGEDIPAQPQGFPFKMCAQRAMEESGHHFLSLHLL